MWIREVLLFVTALFGGMAVSGGTFAFLMVIGVLPRMLRRIQEQNQILPVETTVTAAVIIGTISSLIEVEERSVMFPALGELLLAIYGLSAGIFVGCVAVALAEILDTFPIVFRRLRLTRGLSLVLCVMAIGKVLGALFSFYGGYRF